MRPTMHAKTDSEATSIDASSPPRTMYYVESPSPLEMEKLSLNLTPADSPPSINHHHLQAYHYRVTPIHHSRESSASRFSSASFKQSYASGLGSIRKFTGWKRMRRVVDDGEVEEEDEKEFVDVCERDPNQKVRTACLFVLGFLILVSVFSLSLWGTSKARRPRVTVQNVVFQSFDLQAGVDDTGLTTQMVSLNSTVAIIYANRGMFFGIHVSSTPWELHCYQLKVASGQMEEFFEERKSKRMVVTVVQGHQVPVYGAVTAIKDIRDKDKFVLPMNLTLTVRSKAYILGKLVRSKFVNQVRCPVRLRGDQLGKKLNVINCVYTSEA